MRKTVFHPAVLLAAFLLATVAAACGGPGATPTPPPPTEISLMTHDSFAVSPEVLESFQSETGVTVRILKAGDAGSLVNQAILTRDNPLADVLYGVDNTFLSRALDAGIFEAHEGADLSAVPDELELDPQRRVTPIDYGDVCPNFDREAFADSEPPATLEDLAEPAYRSMLVVENPATSSPGLAFLLATIVRFGESGDYTWLDYWTDLRANDVVVEPGWDTAYFGRFSGGSGEGDRPIVVSYATSPVAEAQGIEPTPAVAPTGVIDDGCFRQVEFAAVMSGSDAPEIAGAFVEHMLSPEFQADIPLNMYVFPARSDTEVPEVFAQHAARITEPLTMDATRISANRERWIEEWTDTVVR
jgi:thiamine transport system substrate-binding protein